MSAARAWLFGAAVSAVAACAGPAPIPARTSSSAAPKASSQPSSPDDTEDRNVLRIGGATLRLQMVGPSEPALEAALRQWVELAATLVSDYLGAFPVPELDVQLELTPGNTVGFGQHFDGRRVQVSVGKHVDEATLAHDWVMVHEMLHSAFPDLDAKHRWMQEGLSTYLESVLRVRAGVMSEDEMWQKWVRRMPYGLVQQGEGGLDETPTWGRIYWGGALFWLLVDLELLRASHGQSGLQQVLRAMRARGVNAREHWSTEQVVEFADEVTGQQVVSRLYREHALTPAEVSLPKLWRRLGVVRDMKGRVTLDDRAPWASLRRAMSGS